MKNTFFLSVKAMLNGFIVGALVHGMFRATLLVSFGVGIAAAASQFFYEQAQLPPRPPTEEEMALVKAREKEINKLIGIQLLAVVKWSSIILGAMGILIILWLVAK